MTSLPHRLARRIALLGGVAVLALATPAAAEPDDPPGTLALDPTSARPGQSFAVTATGLPERCASVRFFWRETTEDYAQVSGGEASATLTVPGDASPGIALIETNCYSSEPHDDWSPHAGPNAELTVLEPDPVSPPPMSLKLSPTSGPAEGTVQVTGEGFDCGLNADDIPRSVRVGWVDGTDPVEVTPDAAGGSFAVDLPVAPGPDGEREVEAACEPRGHRQVEKFTVLTLPTPTPTVTSRDSGTIHTERSEPTTASPATSPSPSTTTRTPSVSSPSIAAVAPQSPAPTAPAAAGATPIRAGWAMPTLDRVSLAWPRLLLTAAFVVLLMVLIAFTSEIFNKTYEDRRLEIHKALRALGTERPGWLRRPPWLQATVLIGTAALIAILFSFDEGPAMKEPPGRNLPLHIVGLLIAVPAVMAAYAGPGEIYLRRVRGRARLHVPPMGLAVGIVCALLSGASNLRPSYAYGLFATFVLFARKGDPNPAEPTKTQRARAILLGVGGLILLIALGYQAFSANWAGAHGGHASQMTVLIDAVSYWIVVLGSESLVFALMPMRFLDGHTVAGWRLLVWAPLQAGAAFFFLHVVQRRGDANHVKIDDIEWIRAFVFFALFGAASLAFWGYFQWDKRPTKKWAGEEPLKLPELIRPHDFFVKLGAELGAIRDAVRARLPRRAPQPASNDE